MLAYFTIAKQTKEYTRIAESTSTKAMKQWCKAVRHNMKGGSTCILLQRWRYCTKWISIHNGDGQVCWVVLTACIGDGRHVQ